MYHLNRATYLILAPVAVILFITLESELLQRAQILYRDVVVYSHKQCLLKLTPHQYLITSDYIDSLRQLGNSLHVHTYTQN